jgi:hypothetical protein
MTDKEVLAKYTDMKKFFGNKLPSFEHHPNQFATCVKLYNFYKEREALAQGDLVINNPES